MDELRKRLTYLMLFRVGLVTLLLIATAAAELAAPIEPQPPALAAMFGLIGATYGLTIVYALLLRRTTRVRLLAAVQLWFDLIATTALVHLTGGSESVFAFMYLLVIVGASTVLSQRGALWSTGAAIVLYATALAARHFGIGAPASVSALEPRDLLRAIAVNAVAFAATGALSSRLAVQLTQADERIQSQRMWLRDLATLHQDVIRCLTSGLITVTDEGRVVTFNAAAGEIAGIDPVGAIGRPIAELLPTLAPLLRTSHPREAMRRIQINHVGADGIERVLGVSLSPLVDAEGRALGRIVNFQDLTELRRMEEAVTRSERLAAVGRLAAGIAHEIRNPLAAISGSIELLSQTAALPANNDSTELMAIVLREVERLNALITDLLEFARPRRPDPQRLDFGATLHEMLRVFENDKRLSGARVELEAPEPVFVDADAGQLRQLVWNLLRNAAEASPAGSPITVQVTAEKPTWARLTVRDRGAGITPEARARLFEPFYSTKERGTGLGLATVHRIVEEHGGEIAVELPPDGGTAMTVRLPLGS